MASRSGRTRKPRSDGFVQDVTEPKSEDQGIKESPKPAKSKVFFALYDRNTVIGYS